MVGFSAVGYSGVGPTLYIPEITADHPITIDGKLDDWAAYKPVATTKDLRDVLGGKMQPKEDFDVKLYIGWNPADNILYFAAAVTDDIHNADCTHNGDRHLDDCMEVLIDADNSEGGYRGGPVDGLQAQQFGLLPTPGAGIAQF